MGSLRRKTHTDETALSDPEPFQADMCSALTNSFGAGSGKRIAIPRCTAGGRLVVIPAKCSFFEIITSCFAPAGIDGTVV
jgi:hypothetical protein